MIEVSLCARCCAFEVHVHPRLLGCMRTFKFPTGCAGVVCKGHFGAEFFVFEFKMFNFWKENAFFVVFGAFVLSVPASCAAPPGGAQALQQLTEFRKSHRRTVDGRLCAAAFVQDDQTYTDCTAAKAPNGTAGTAFQSAARGQLQLLLQAATGATWRCSCWARAPRTGTTACPR